MSKKPEPLPPTKQVIASLFYKCESCEEIGEEVGGKLYECSNCGTFQVDEKRCEGCNKFMAKVADESCVECEEGEVVPVYAVSCVCHSENHEVA